MFVWCILYIPSRDICEHVNLDSTSQYNGVLSIHFCSNHNLASPLNDQIYVDIKFFDNNGVCKKGNGLSFGVDDDTRDMK